jgi:hypothetical protein
MFVRSSGTEGYPIIIDSVDHTISKLLSGKLDRYSYGKQYIIPKNIQTNISSFLDQIIQDLNNNIKKTETFDTFSQFKYRLGLEDGSLVDPSLTIEYIYRKHKYSDDILYLLLTKELTIYGYIISLFKYIGF